MPRKKSVKARKKTGTADATRGRKLRLPSPTLIAAYRFLDSQATVAGTIFNPQGALRLFYEGQRGPANSACQELKRRGLLVPTGRPSEKGEGNSKEYRLKPLPKNVSRQIPSTETADPGTRQEVSRVPQAALLSIKELRRLMVTLNAHPDIVRAFLKDDGSVLRIRRTLDQLEEHDFHVIEADGRFVIDVGHTQI